MAVIILIAAVCTGFFAGRYTGEKRQAELREQKYNTMVSFAVDKLGNMEPEYNQDDMEALISNIYAAYEYCDDGSLSSAIHDLWNALIFDGENIAGMEDELITALNDNDAEAIESIASQMRK